jgi:hypothetical protein
MARKKGSGGDRIFITGTWDAHTRTAQASSLFAQEAPAISVKEMQARAYDVGTHQILNCKGCRSGNCSRHMRPRQTGETAAIRMDRPAETNEGALASNESAPVKSYLDEPDIDVPVIRSDAPPAAPVIAVASVQAVLPIGEPPAPVAKKGPRAKNTQKRHWPEGFVLTDEMRAYAEKHGVARARVDAVFEDFRLHHSARGSVFVDWTFAFYTWARNDKKYGPKNGSSVIPKASAVQGGGKDELPW